MPETAPGYNTEQKVVTVPNTDTDINNEITAQSDTWLVSSLTLFNDDSNVIILFTRTIPASA